MSAVPGASAKTPVKSGRLSASNWTAGQPVSLFAALGFNVPVGFQYPKLTASLPSEMGKSSGTPAAAPVNASMKAWFEALLKAIGAPASNANLNSLASWYSRENSKWPPTATNNPFNTTFNAAGATTFNSVGVKNYPSAQSGLQATVNTLNNGYPKIVAALKAGAGLCGGSLAADFTKWSGGGYSSVCPASTPAAGVKSRL